MKAVGVILLGAGAYLAYYAVKNEGTHPVQHVKTALKSLSGSSSSTSSSNADTYGGGSAPGPVYPAP